MLEGPRKFLLHVEKQKSFFPNRGELTARERTLSRFLGTYIERQRISLASFGAGDLASVEKISADREKIKEQKARIKKGKERILESNPEHFFATERGILSEQVMIHGMQNGEWFGKGANVRVASEYDDLFNGVDCVIEFDSTKQLAIGIDTTISIDQINQKLRRIRDQILDGKLAEVRYFKNDDFTGSLHNVPLTIIGVNLEANSSLSQLVYDLETTDQFHSEDRPDKKDNAKKEIKAHIVQFIILFEIRMQLEAFLRFITERNKIRSIENADKLIAKLTEELEKIKGIMAEKAPKNKTEKEKLVSEIKNDEVFRIIKQALQIEFAEWEESEIFVAKIK